MPKHSQNIVLNYLQCIDILNQPKLLLNRPLAKVPVNSFELKKLQGLVTTYARGLIKDIVTALQKSDALNEYHKTI